MKHLYKAALLTFLFSFHPAFSQQNEPSAQFLIPCGTSVPEAQWEKLFSRLVQDFKLAEQSGKSQMQVYTIPVIVHVIHSGQSVGTYPNLAQGQINSQIRVLNEDFGGVGYNKANYPAGAFSAWAANQNLPAANLDVLGRVKIANCEVQFCLATKDTLGNLLPEPGIERINYVNKGWSNPASFGSTTTFINYMNGTIKPQSIWKHHQIFQHLDL